MQANLALVFVLALAYTGQAKDGIKCWTCSKENIADCEDSEQSTCDGKCTKTVLHAGGLLSISRSCLPVCVDINTGEDGLFCCDNADLCNGATTLSSFSFLTFLGAAILALYNWL